MTVPIPRTMVHQLHQTAERLKTAPALWTQRGGAWVPTTWRQYADLVKVFSLGLQSLGFQPRQALVVMSSNREEWVVASLAAMAAGGVAVGVHVAASPAAVAEVVGHCEATLALVENEALLDKLQAERGRLPALRRVISMEAPATPREGGLTYAEVLERGRAGDDADYFARVDGLQPEALAQLVYPLGATGPARGVMLSHRNLCWTAVHLSSCHPTGPEDMALSYLPMPHLAEQLGTVYGPLVTGAQVSFAESHARLGDELVAVRPTIFFGVPRVWEALKARLEADLAMQPQVKQRALRWARDVARRYHDDAMNHRQSSITLQGQYALARRTVLHPVKVRLGLERARLLASGGAPIARTVLEFFTSLDLVIAEVYGQAETTGATAVSTTSAIKQGKVGRPMPGVEVRIAEDGEILVRGGNVFLGYLKEPASTGELLAEGWLRSGDLGRLDDDGFLELTGRKRERRSAPRGP